MTVSEGSASVEPIAESDATPVSIGTLSALYTGFLSVWDAASLGLVSPDAPPTLASVFGGPAPWMYDFF